MFLPHCLIAWNLPFLRKITFRDFHFQSIKNFNRAKWQKNTLGSPFSPFKFLQSVRTKWALLSLIRLDRLSDLTCCKMFVCISNKAKMHIILAVKCRIMWARKPCKKETHLLPSNIKDELPRPPSPVMRWLQNRGEQTLPQDFAALGCDHPLRYFVFLYHAWFSGSCAISEEIFSQN